MKTSAAADSVMKTLWFKDRVTSADSYSDDWYKAVVYIPAANTKNYQIVIEVQRQHENHSPFSIDDISFSKECRPSLTATLDPRPVTPSPPPGCKSGEYKCGTDPQCIPAEKYCNFVADCKNGADEKYCPDKCTFEDKAIGMKTCRWYNSWFYDQMDWVVHQGQTPSNDTGPPNDHTLNSKLGKILLLFLYT